MDQFKLFVELGLTHVLDIEGYDHVLFLILLTVPYLFKDWKKVLSLVTLFTIGHTAALLLSAFKLVDVDASLVEFLIPVTILITGFYNLIVTSRLENKSSINILSISTLFFGIIHGLGFSGYYKMVMSGTDEKWTPLLSFALGIEFAQLIVVLVVLLLAFIAQHFLRISKRDWIVILSSIVIGVTIPIILERI